MWRGKFSYFPKLAENTILLIIGINTCFRTIRELDTLALHFFPETTNRLKQKFSEILCYRGNKYQPGKLDNFKKLFTKTHSASAIFLNKNSEHK